MRRVLLRTMLVLSGTGGVRVLIFSLSVSRHLGCLTHREPSLLIVEFWLAFLSPVASRDDDSF